MQTRNRLTIDPLTVDETHRVFISGDRGVEIISIDIRMGKMVKVPKDDPPPIPGLKETWNVSYDIKFHAKPILAEWIEENLRSGWDVQKSQEGFLFLFKDATDAVAFRMRWS